MQRNTLQIIENMKGKINPHYDMLVSDMDVIYTSGENIVDIISNAFKFGYAQGAKAQKKEDKRRAK
ncbi:MAG: hypothetical protein HFE78_08520 [Clostridiales bacterium]|nr:hypothetical protein [Clostridiales bacterium]